MVLALSWPASASGQEATPENGYMEQGVPQPTPAAGGSSAYPEGDFYKQLRVAGGEGPCGCDEWGCGGSPYRTGPGCGDDWLVGPRWRITLDGVMLYREETDLDALAGALGTTLGDVEQFENFDHGAGVRLSGGAYWPQCKNYELTMAYIGVEEWNANLVLPVVTNPPVVGPPASVAVDERRTLSYKSSLHALEINFQALNQSVWKPYAGIRYFGLDEKVRDETRQYPTVPLAVTEAAITTQLIDSAEVDNNLIGFQLGLRRDLWKVARKVYVEGFANAGVYCNLINRIDSDTNTTISSEVLDDDPATTDVDEAGQVQTLTNTTGNRVKTERTEASFATEMSLALVWKINNCCALRGGYELLYINGVELGGDAFLGSEAREDMLYHGGFAGFEYRR